MLLLDLIVALVVIVMEVVYQFVLLLMANGVHGVPGAPAVQAAEEEHKQEAVIILHVSVGEMIVQENHHDHALQ